MRNRAEMSQALKNKGSDAGESANEVIQRYKHDFYSATGFENSKPQASNGDEISYGDLLKPQDFYGASLGFPIFLLEGRLSRLCLSFLGNLNRRTWFFRMLKSWVPNKELMKAQLFWKLEHVSMKSQLQLWILHHYTRQL